MKRSKVSGGEPLWKHPEQGEVRIYVWEWPVRFSHWILVLTVVSLSITGYYMHSPYIVARGREAYVMGTMRFVHLQSAFLFTGAILLRFVWFFLGNEWAHWTQYIPTTRKRWRQVGAVGKYYTFTAWLPTSFIGHNPLAGLAYMIVYCMAAIEIVTGVVLYANVLGSSTLNMFVAWIPRVIDIQWLREIHFITMFGFWMFFLHHIYTAMLVAVEEESGLMESIFTGWKFFPERLLKRFENEAMSAPALETVPGVVEETEKTATQR